MKSNEVRTTLKHPKTINGNIEYFSKRIENEYKDNVTFTSRI